MGLSSVFVQRSFVLKYCVGDGKMTVTVRAGTQRNERCA